MADSISIVMEMNDDISAKLKSIASTSKGVSKEFEVLRLLCGAPSRVLTKEDIYQTVWREPSNGCLHAVENTVFQLRRKLRPLGGAGLIETVAGYGYKLAAGVCVEAD